MSSGRDGNSKSLQNGDIVRRFGLSKLLTQVGLTIIVTLTLGFASLIGVALLYRSFAS